MIAMIAITTSSSINVTARERAEADEDLTQRREGAKEGPRGDNQ